MRQFGDRSLSLSIASAIFLWLVVSCGLSHADEGSSVPLAAETSRIAIADFATSNAQVAEVAVRIRQTIKDKLSRLRSYTVSDASDVKTSMDRVPEFPIWQSRNVRVLILGKVVSPEYGRLRISSRAWNVPEHEQISGQQIDLRPEDWREAADTLADDILVHLGHPELAR
jgi:Tol biopolymer transport system component